MAFNKYIPLFEDFNDENTYTEDLNPNKDDASLYSENDSDSENNEESGESDNPDDSKKVTMRDIIEKNNLSLNDTISPEELEEKIKSNVVVFISGNKVNGPDDVDSEAKKKNDRIRTVFEELKCEVYNSFGGWKEDNWKKHSNEPSLIVVAPNELYGPIAMIAILLSKEYNQTSVIITKDGTPIMYTTTNEENPDDVIPSYHVPSDGEGYVFSTISVLHLDDEAPQGYTMCGDLKDSVALQFD